MGVSRLVFLFSQTARIIIMLTRIIVALFLFMFSLTTFAEEGTHPSYVSIKMRSDALDTEPLTRTICGGVVVDEEKNLVATAWHCVPNQRSVIEKPGIFSIGNMGAKLVSFSPEADLALFQVSHLQGLKAPKFSTPEKGTRVVASAYYDDFPVTPQSSDRFFPPMSIQAVLDWGGIVSAVKNAKQSSGEHFDKIVQTEFKWIVISGTAAPGFSGGPVFDTVGNFVGILSNNFGGFTNISSSENVTHMIKNLK